MYLLSETGLQQKNTDAFLPKPPARASVYTCALLPKNKKARKNHALIRIRSADANLVLFFPEPECGSFRQEGCELSLFNLQAYYTSIFPCFAS